MLENVHKIFIDKFIQTNSPELAAKEAGVPVKEALRAGIEFLKNEEIREAIQQRLNDFNEAYSSIKFDKQTLLRLLMLQYEQANKAGKTKEATDILIKIGEVQGIKLNEVKMEPINFIIKNLDENSI